MTTRRRDATRDEMRDLIEDHVDGPDGCVDAVLDAIKKIGGQVIGIKVEEGLDGVDDFERTFHDDRVTQTDEGGVLYPPDLTTHGNG